MERFQMTRIDLTRFSWARSLLLSRWPQFLARAVTLAGFVFTILVGLLGSVVGSHNFAIIFVWIAWWTALKLFFIPFGGRSWCSICPIPMPGEWLQRGGIVQPTGKGFGLNRRWPKILRGKWLQAGGFLLIGLFGALTLTSAQVTAWVLLGIILLSLVLSLVFERRSFCNYLCPIGGFTGLYAQAGPVEVRVKDKDICAAHTEKTCYTACPWGQYPLALKSSADCGLCMECLRVCPSDNLAVNLRPWGTDLGTHTRHKLDETFLGLVMVASALLDSAVFLGPWGQLKSAAYAIGSLPWWGFTGAFLVLALVLLPALFTLFVWAGLRWSGAKTGLRQALAQQGQVLVPLGMLSWIAFTVSFAFTKFGYVLPVVSDPLGWGWKLLGEVGQAGVGEITPVSLLLQVALLVVGLFWSSRVARRIADAPRPGRQALPLVVFSALVSLGMLWLLVG
jgi:hypothetical protein